MYVWVLGVNKRHSSGGYTRRTAIDVHAVIGGSGVIKLVRAVWLLGVTGADLTGLVGLLL